MEDLTDSANQPSRKMKRDVKQRITFLEDTSLNSVQELKSKSELIHADFEMIFSESKYQIGDLLRHFIKAEAKKEDLEQQNGHFPVDIRDSLIRETFFDQKTQSIHGLTNLEQIQKEFEAKEQHLLSREIEEIR